MENLFQVIKDPEEFIYIGNKHKKVGMAFYDDYVSDLGIQGTLDSIDNVDSYIEIYTDIGFFKFPKDTKLLVKDKEDFSEEILSVLAKDVTYNHYLVLKQEDLKIVPNSYLKVKDRKDIKYTKVFNLVRKIDVPAWFLLTSVRVGVPDFEEFNKRLDNYLHRNDLTHDELRDQIINTYHTVLPSKILIEDWYLNLLLMCVTNKYTIEEHSIVLNFDSESELYLESIISFMDKYKIYYVQKDSKLYCYSSFICSLFLSSFNSFSELDSLRKYKYILKELLKYKTFVKDTYQLRIFQRFLLNHNILSSIENGKLTIIDNNYFKVDSNFFIPVLFVSSIKGSPSKCLNIKSCK